VDAPWIKTKQLHCQAPQVLLGSPAQYEIDDLSGIPANCLAHIAIPCFAANEGMQFIHLVTAVVRHGFRWNNGSRNVTDQFEHRNLRDVQQPCDVVDPASFLEASRNLRFHSSAAGLVSVCSLLVLPATPASVLLGAVPLPPSLLASAQAVPAGDILYHESAKIAFLGH
jgi:hypothetical protein